MIKELVKRTFRVPVVADTPGNGEVIARQLDIALMNVGFKLSGDLLEHLGRLHPVAVKNVAADILAAVRELVGDYVKHNTYFINFPDNVPDTEDFWTQCIIDALFDPDSASKIALQLSVGVVNLLDLPKYGKYLHSYEEMVAAHEQFIPSVKDRVTILHLGKTLPEEALNLYHSLAGSPIPLNENDRELLQELAEVCLTDPQPESIPVRENKAVINRVRLENHYSLLVDTATDILRVACVLSGGDVTLQEKTKFKSFSRKVRRSLLRALNKVVESSPDKLADVNQYREEWKRLGERLHPYEYNLPYARDVFAVARGDKKVCSLAAKVELAFADNNIALAIALLATAPGMLFRNLDRLLRSVKCKEEAEALLETVQTVIGKVSGRVILSVREHLQNRMAGYDANRIFANSKGTAWTKSDTREVLDSESAKKLLQILDKEVLRRMPTCGNLLVDNQILNVAIPLSDKNRAAGFAVIPRGSVMPVQDGILRFFIYWKQHHEQTDYDLSALMLDENFQYLGHVSWTRYHDGDDCAVYSGDITNAPNGASEFIDIDLKKIDCKYIIPQINFYSGENFQEVEEVFFGFMERTPEQKGKPFEARTVRTKSDIRGKGKVALPLVFAKDDDGKWTAKWLHLYLNGRPNMNRVEANRVNASLLAKSIIDREYLNLGYLVELMRQKAVSFSWYEGQKTQKPVTFIGLEVPEGLPVDSTAISLANLQELIPV